MTILDSSTNNMNSGKAYEKVIDYVKNKILNGELRLGEKLPPERELAQTLDVSRNSVREAIRTLDIMGVLSSQQGAGNYVSSNFEKNLVESMAMMFILQEMNYEQLSQLRAGIEIKALDLAVDNKTQEQMLLLKQIVSEMAVSKNEERNVVLDKKLHFTIAQASNNKLIIDILHALSSVMDIFISDLRREILSNSYSGDQLQESHEKLVECIERGDKEGAHQAMLNHFSIVDTNIQGTYKQ